jgi:hypothetical protein
MNPNKLFFSGTEKLTATESSLTNWIWRPTVVTSDCLQVFQFFKEKPEIGIFA